MSQNVPPRPGTSHINIRYNFSRNEKSVKISPTNKAISHIQVTYILQMMT